MPILRWDLPEVEMCVAVMWLYYKNVLVSCFYGYIDLIHVFVKVVSRSLLESLQGQFYYIAEVAN